MKTKIIFLILVFCKLISVKSQDLWQPVDLSGGRIIALTANSSNGMLYAARFDNVYSSSNNGVSWNKISSQDFFSLIYSIGVSPNGYFYAGLEGGGIWWTNNNGASWDFNSLHVSGQGQFATVETIGINPIGNVFAGTALTGQYRSNNNGGSWQHFIIQGLDDFDAVTQYAFKGVDTIFAATTAGVYRSTNNASDWSLVGNIGSPFVNTIVTAANGDLYIGTKDNGFYHSNDNGNSWVNKNTGLLNLNISSISLGTGNTIFAGTSGNGVFISTNNGSTWSLAGSGGDRQVNTTIFSNGNIFAGSSTGIYKSSDLGSAWSSSNNGIKLNNINAIVPSTDDKLFIGSQSGIYYSSNNGVSWEIRGKDIPYNFEITEIKKKNDGSLYVLASKNGGALLETKIYRSINNGIDFSDITANLASEKIYNIMVSDNVIAVVSKPLNTQYRVFTSTNEGLSWDMKIDRDQTIYGFSDMNTMGDIFVQYKNFATDDSLISSIDGGNSWQFINGISEIGNPVVNFGINRFNNDIFVIYPGLIKYSANSGNTWQSSGAGWNSNTSITKTAFNSIGTIFIGTYNRGIYVSENNGLNWVNYSSGIPSYVNGGGTFFSGINSLQSDDEGYMYAGTYGDGLFRSTYSTTVGINNISGKIPSVFKLYQNYPNPFNPSTKIKFDISKSSGSYVQLKIYNILGDEVQSLINENLKPGSYEVSWDASNYASGTYFYKLTSGDFTQTKKLLLIK